MNISENSGAKGFPLNSGERIPCPLCGGVSEQDTKKVLDGIGFPAALRRGVSIFEKFR